MFKFCSMNSSHNQSTSSNLASGKRNIYTIDFLTQLIEKEESEDNFRDVNKHAGELVSMSRHVQTLCKHLDGTAFYASNYGSSLKRSAYDLYKMLKEDTSTNDSEICKEDEEIKIKAERELKFLTLYAKIGEILDKNIRAITQKLKDWLADANRVIDFDSFVKAEERYVHYKNKITRLINEVEEMGINGKKITSKKKRRIERNIIKFKTQKQLMVILCQGKLEEAKEYIDKADILGPAGLTLLKKAIIDSTNQAHKDLGTLASSMNINQIKLANSNSKLKKSNFAESNLKGDLKTSANSKQFQMENSLKPKPNINVGKGLKMFQKKPLRLKSEEDVNLQELSLMGREIDQDLDKKSLGNSSGDELNESAVKAVDIEKTFPKSGRASEDGNIIEKELENKVIQSFVESQKNINRAESPRSKLSKQTISNKIKESFDKLEDDGHINPYKNEKGEEKEKNPWGEAFGDTHKTLDFGKGFSPNKDILKDKEDVVEVKGSFWETDISPIDEDKTKKFFEKKNSVNSVEDESKKSFRKRHKSNFVITGDENGIEDDEEEEKKAEIEIKKVEEPKKKSRSRSSRRNQSSQKRGVGVAIKIVPKKSKEAAKKKENGDEEKEKEEIVEKFNTPKPDIENEEEHDLDGDHDLTDWNPPEINDFRNTPNFEKFIPNSMDSVEEFVRPEDFEGLKFTKPEFNKQSSPTIDLDYENTPKEKNNKKKKKSIEKIDEVNTEEDTNEELDNHIPLKKVYTFKEKNSKENEILGEELNKDDEEEIVEEIIEEATEEDEKEVVKKPEEIEENEEEDSHEEDYWPDQPEKDEEKTPTESEDKEKNPFFNFEKNDNKKDEKVEDKFSELSISLDKFGKIDTSREISPSSGFGNFDNFGNFSQPFDAKESQDKSPENGAENEGNFTKGIFGKKSKENIVQSNEKKTPRFDEEDEEEEEKELESAIDNVDSDIETNVENFKIKTEEKKDKENLEDLAETNSVEENEENKIGKNIEEVEDQSEEEDDEKREPEDKREEDEEEEEDIDENTLEPEAKVEKEIPEQSHEEPDKNFSKHQTLGGQSSATEFPSEYQFTPAPDKTKNTNNFDLTLQKTTSLAQEIQEKQEKKLMELEQEISEENSSNIFKGFDLKNNSELEWGKNDNNKEDDIWGNNWGDNDEHNDSWNDRSQSVDLEPLQISGAEFGTNDKDPFADI